MNLDILTEEEIEALLNFPKLDTPKLIRDKAIFEVLYGTGIKVSELVDMDIDDVDLELDYIYCNISKNKRVIPLSDITKIYLEKYIKEARTRIEMKIRKCFICKFLRAKVYKTRSLETYKKICKYR